MDQILLTPGEDARSAFLASSQPAVNLLLVLITSHQVPICLGEALMGQLARAQLRKYCRLDLVPNHEANILPRRVEPLLHRALVW